METKKKKNMITKNDTNKYSNQRVKIPIKPIIRDRRIITNNYRTLGAYYARKLDPITIKAEN